MKINVQVYWIESGEIEVDGEGETVEECVEDAIRKVQEDDSLWDIEGSYVDSSFTVDEEFTKEIYYQEPIEK